jgi:hypothetical protein
MAAVVPEPEFTIDGTVERTARTDLQSMLLTSGLGMLLASDNVPV